MPKLPGLPPGYTEEAEGNLGRGAGVFREVALQCARHCQQAVNSMLGPGGSHLKIGHQDQQAAEQQQECTLSGRVCGWSFCVWILLMSTVLRCDGGVVIFFFFSQWQHGLRVASCDGGVLRHCPGPCSAGSLWCLSGLPFSLSVLAPDRE